MKLEAKKSTIFLALLINKNYQKKYTRIRYFIFLKFLLLQTKNVCKPKKY